MKGYICSSRWFDRRQRPHTSELANYWRMIIKKLTIKNLKGNVIGNITDAHSSPNQRPVIWTLHTHIPM